MLQFDSLQQDLFAELGPFAFVRFLIPGEQQPGELFSDLFPRSSLVERHAADYFGMDNAFGAYQLSHRSFLPAMAFFTDRAFAPMLLRIDAGSPCHIICPFAILFRVLIPQLTGFFKNALRSFGFAHSIMVAAPGQPLWQP